MKIQFHIIINYYIYKLLLSSNRSKEDNLYVYVYMWARYSQRSGGDSDQESRGKGVASSPRLSCESVLETACQIDRRHPLHISVMDHSENFQLNV